MPLPVFDRPAALARLAAEPFDVLVVGGGITGCGAARDLAMRGLRTALVEADDWASGTSSRSSRLVHGGVRYLEHGHLGMVFEASRERRTLLRIAPHLVRPLAFTWPVYRGARVPRWKLRAGLLAYDALALFRNVGRHAALSAGGVLEREPAVERDGLTGGAAYWDASTSDMRLTLANAVAAAEAGAACANHLAVVALRRDRRGRPSGVEVEDRLTGERFDVAARVVVGAAGPWGDLLRRLAVGGAGGGAPASLRGTKGVHVLVERARLGNRGALTLLSPVDGRVMFALPAGPRFAIVGTTDTPTDAAPGAARADEGDVAYLLATANRFFPAARIERGDVIAAWAGVRPLVASAFGASASAASREHLVERAGDGLVLVSGGKLTTYRQMASEIADAVDAMIGRPGRRAPTDTVPLPGGDGDVDAERAAAAATTGDDATAARLVAAHGTRWRAAWPAVARDARLAAPFADGVPYTGAELLHAARAEMAPTLADLLVRRVPVAFETRDAGRAAARAADALLVAHAGWDAAGRERRLAMYDAEAGRIFDVDP